MKHEMIFKIIFSSVLYWGGFSSAAVSPACSHQVDLEASFNKFLSALRRKQASTRGLCKSGSLYGHTTQKSLRQ